MEFNVPQLQSDVINLIENSSKLSDNLDFIHELEDYKTKYFDGLRLIKKLENELIDTKNNNIIVLNKLNEESQKQNEKYDRLYESHKRISRLNHELEEKVLNMIENTNNNHESIEKDRDKLLDQCKSSEFKLKELEKECERYKNDCLVAVQLLQNNPSSFLNRKIDTLPVNIKDRLQQLRPDIPWNDESNESRTSLIQSPTQQYASSNMPIMTYPPTCIHHSDLQRNHSTGDLHNLIDTVTLAGILHPDYNNNKSKPPVTVISYEYMCTNCNDTKHSTDQVTQTTHPRRIAPDSFYPSSNSQSRPATNNANTNNTYRRNIFPNNNPVLEV